MIVSVFMSCKQGTLTHNRFIKNNTAADTVFVNNPDFDNAKDTLFPGDTALIYTYEILDTQQEYEACKWMGDTLIIRNQDGNPLMRSVKTEAFWTYAIRGDFEREQNCTFIISTGDF